MDSVFYRLSFHHSRLMYAKTYNNLSDWRISHSKVFTYHINYGDTGSLIENNKIRRKRSLIRNINDKKLNTKKPRQDDGASFYLSFYA
jgi:hypothetical protein